MIFLKSLTVASKQKQQICFWRKRENQNVTSMNILLSNQYLAYGLRRRYDSYECSLKQIPYKNNNEMITLKLFIRITFFVVKTNDNDLIRNHKLIMKQILIWLNPTIIYMFHILYWLRMYHTGKSQNFSLKIGQSICNT